jgi:uncharacterized membrane protein
MSVLLRAAALGVATGGRTATGLAALAFTRSAFLRRPWVRGLTALAAVGELVADKTPAIPSRLTPPALAGRVVAGVLGTAALARREGVSPVLPVLVATGAVVAGSVAGARWRGYAASKGWPAVPAALVEDAVVIALAAAASRRRS